VIVLQGVLSHLLQDVQTWRFLRLVEPVYTVLIPEVLALVQLIDQLSPVLVSQLRVGGLGLYNLAV
jgi:hypothetical protein